MISYNEVKMKDKNLNTDKTNNSDLGSVSGSPYNYSEKDKSST